MTSTSQSAVPAAGRAIPANWLQVFAPGWFAAVMGTGVLAVTLHFYAKYLPSLDPLAVGLHWLNVAFFVLLAVPWLARWIRHTAAALTSLQHPVQAHFYPTFSIALIVLALQFLVFGHHRDLALALWLPGALLTVLFSFAILALVFHGESITLEHVTPAMFIPPVGLVVIPVAGAPLAAGLEPGWRELLLVFNWAALGAGSLLYVGVLALTMFRYVLGKRVGRPLVPTAWVNLGPLGVIPVSLLNLARCDAAPCRRRRRAGRRAAALGIRRLVAADGLDPHRVGSAPWRTAVCAVRGGRSLFRWARSLPPAGGWATNWRWRRSSPSARQRSSCSPVCG